MDFILDVCRFDILDCVTKVGFEILDCVTKVVFENAY